MLADTIGAINWWITFASPTMSAGVQPLPAKAKGIPDAVRRVALLAEEDDDDDDDDGEACKELEKKKQKVENCKKPKEKVAGMEVVKYEPKNDVKKHDIQRKKTMEKVSKAGCNTHTHPKTNMWRNPQPQHKMACKIAS